MSTSDDDSARERAQRVWIERDIWIGDVLTAWRQLNVSSPLERAAVADALGFDGSALRPATASEVAPQHPTGRGAVAETTTAPGPAGVGQHTEAPRVIPSFIESEDAANEDDVPMWIAAAPTLPAEEPAHHGWKPPHAPLLREHWARHIVAAIAGVPIADGGIDEQGLIDAVSRLRPVGRLPQRWRRTLRRGLQVLLDRGEAMRPFYVDVQDVIASLRTVVARDHLDAAAFEYTPDAGDVLWLRRRVRTPWHPPDPGTPILVISDLGMTTRFADVRAGTSAEWLAFARRCRAAGCPVVALVPRDESTWPSQLREAFTMVPWDERTSVSTALRCLGRGARR